MELSAYFGINQTGTGQFERTLVIADKGMFPTKDVRLKEMKINFMLRVELIALDDAEIKYSTVQNWYLATRW